MSLPWPDVLRAKSECRRELVLKGESISTLLEENDGNLDETIYKLKNLNFLDISCTTLTSISSEISQLDSLTNLSIRDNNLKSVPEQLFKLKKLQFLDLSSNKLSSFPQFNEGCFCKLQSLCLSNNELNSFPDLSLLQNLHIINLSYNKLIEFPSGLTNLVQVLELNLSNNLIEEIPSSITEMKQLKLFNISDNKLKSIAFELSKCSKLKDLNCKDNPIIDKRLNKMLQQCKTKSVLDYLHEAMAKEESGGKKVKKTNKKKKKADSAVCDEVVSKNQIEVSRPSENSNQAVTVTESIEAVRPYIVCCILRNIDFTKDSTLYKKFINLQTRLHEGLCDKRQLATIATHDLTKINFPLVYDAILPQNLKLVPLFKENEVTAAKLVSKLRQEAEEYRKDKKRNMLSGIHKYLDLLKDKSHYPCLIDSTETVISFPPITNSNITKISEETTDIFLEVTSSISTDTCRKVLDETIKSFLELGIGKQLALGDTESEECLGAASQINSCLSLSLEQVKVLSDQGLKIIYPSRVDLISDDYIVKRNY